MEKKAGNAEAQVILVPSYQQWSVMIIEIMRNKIHCISVRAVIFFGSMRKVKLFSWFPVRCWFYQMLIFSGVNFSDVDFFRCWIFSWFSQVSISHMLIFSGGRFGASSPPDGRECCEVGYNHHHSLWSVVTVIVIIIIIIIIYDHGHRHHNHYHHYLWSRSSSS